MARMICPGLPAGWINAWLAAVGATVLDSRIRLHWTGDGTPVAVLSAEDVDPLDAVVASWPDAELLTDLPIAESWKDACRLGRRVPVADFVARARTARSNPYSWTLSSTMTDLYVDERGEVAHAPFDPPGPGTIKWLHHRLMKVHEQVEPSIERIRDSFEGRAVRVKDNGLGFDHTRLGSQSDKTSMWVDPVIEVLAFFGLAILPVRGDGIDRRRSGVPGARERQRGWLRTPGGKGERRFMWPAWCQSLDFAGIDALMDVWEPDVREPRRKEAWSRTGVHAAWKSVQFERRGSADTTRAFGAEQL
ncbi:MAG: hypothetical protein OXH85_10975 [Truepera sp.]|nr:hypothetical protein [Truepera sp.]